MGSLQNRLNRYHSVQTEVRQAVDAGERFERAIPRIEWFDAVLEGDNVMKQRKDSERQGIRRLFQIYDETHGVDTVDDTMDAYDRLKLTTDDVVPMFSQEEIHHMQYHDVVENFLYTEWLEQHRDGTYNPNRIETFSHYCTFVALKAFVNLVTRHQDSLQALLDLGIYIPDDVRNRCVMLKEREDFDPDDPVWYIQHVLAEVPEAWTVSQDLLVHYSEQARLETPETPLPDNPFLDTSDSLRARLRQALHAYVAKEGSVKELSKKYDLTRRQLQDELRNAGLLRGHGGRRKG